MSRAVLAGLVACLLALAGCSPLADLTELRKDLGAAGYEATDLDHRNTNGVHVLSVTVAMPDDVPADDDADRVAEIVWTSYPAEVDRLTVTMNGAVRLDEDADQLTERFGERPAGLAASRTDEGGADVGLIVVVVVIAVLLAGLLVLVWWRGRKPPPPVARPPGYQVPRHHPPQPPRGF